MLSYASSFYVIKSNFDEGNMPSVFSFTNVCVHLFENTAHENCMSNKIVLLLLLVLLPIPIGFHLFNHLFKPKTSNRNWLSLLNLMLASI